MIFFNKSLLIVPILFFFLGCSSRSKEQIPEEDSLENLESSMPTVDSIPVSSFRTLEMGQDHSCALVELVNPYADTIRIRDEYFIYDVASDSLLMKGTHQKVVLAPHSSCQFNVSLGLDSIWYEKMKEYLFLFPGKRNDEEVIYYEINSGLGYVNKLNGVMVLEPDTIVLC